MAYLTRAALLAAVVGLLACGNRPNPSQTDGSPATDGSPPSQPKQDACAYPPGGCHSSSDCPAGQTCQGCGADPCCPLCAVCYGKCVPGTGGCAKSSDCAADSYCHFPTGSCAQGGSAGVCKKRPQGCYTLYAPVCGCDDKTYGNDCGAWAAGVSIKHKGECKLAKCTSLYNAYKAAVPQAKACCSMCDAIQCTKKVKHRLACGCDTYVSATNASVINKLASLEKEWAALSCGKLWACANYQCPAVTGATCAPTSVGGGSCKDLSTGP